MIILLVTLVVLTALVLLMIHTPRLTVAVMALAGISALTAVVLSTLGAATAAVIELSVGAGLVAVLFAFTNGILGGGDTANRPPLRRWIALLIAFPLIALLLVLASSSAPAEGASAGSSTFRDVFWGERSPDIFVQLALLFAGVLGVLGLLPTSESAPSEASRDTSEHVRRPT